MGVNLAQAVLAWSSLGAIRPVGKGSGRCQLTPLRAQYAETVCNRLEQAANQYHVSRRVLRTLSELTSTLGVGAEARKLGKGSKNRAPTPAEKTWIEAVVRVLIRRAALS